ncbi:MAG: N-acetyltransferase [Pseudomonadota bacterium]
MSIGTQQLASVRDARIEDRAAVLELLPSLADFDLPSHRNPEHLWRGDAALVEQHLAGESESTFLLIAETASVPVAGLALTTLKPELLSGAPSAHLEALAVSQGQRGLGLGRQLLQATQLRAKVEGAQSLTLHVFASNTRARSVYEAAGFEGELLRYTKIL